MQFYAHSKEKEPPENWQKLDEHLQNVASLAADFAAPFGGGEWARLAGLWHDLGKYTDDFQRKLHGEKIDVVHAEAGGHLAQQRMAGGKERVFCWLIMGHHTGLADYGSSATGAKALEPKMRNPKNSDVTLRNVPDAIKNQAEPAPPAVLKNGGDVSFFIRMLFSCLLDADFLDTEAFMDEGYGRLREMEYPALHELLIAFDRKMDEFAGAEPNRVNRIRADVLRQCRAAAGQVPSVFSLTVPTGGGKTLSSLAFALRHAVKHGKRRIIYVIPYTSIIEQTASVFREIPGFENAVLEHHCNMVADDESRETKRARLATENWDAPIIVTTSVQFFESLYACKPSRCRKLHNIVDSVVIFDEVQCLPPRFLRPIVFAVRELYLRYGVTPVLCTATQPVLDKTDCFDFEFREGFENVVEIIEDPASLYSNLERVRVEVFENFNSAAYEAIAEAMLEENRSVLCIVNRKDDARTLTGLLPEKRTIHLSTNMCAAHRFQTLEDIKQRLKQEAAPLFVVSTSLVEAGVELDFPVVYRALAGLDSIAQSAGRCNREGKLPNLGKTVVFMPEEQPTYVKTSASLAKGYLKKEKLPDVFQPETLRSYFEQRFFQLGESALDEQRILELLGGPLDFSFRTAAERFRLIDDDWQSPLIIPFDEAPKLVDRLLQLDVCLKREVRLKREARFLFRKLQRYTISVPKKQLDRLLAEKHARELLPGYPGACVLENEELYTDRFGFIPPGEVYSQDTDSIGSQEEQT